MGQEGQVDMTVRKALEALIHLFVVMGAAGLALLCAALPVFPVFRMQVADAVLNRPEACVAAAAGFGVSALALAVGYWRVHRGRFLHLQMGRHAASIDTKLIRQSVEDLFQRQFEGQIQICEVTILQGHKLQLEVTGKTDEMLLAEAEAALEILLRERFGYQEPFDFISEDSELPPDQRE
jgi:hypothetical protein